MTRRFLGYGRQTIDEADIAAVVGVLNGDFLTQGPAVERFEAALAERVGARHAIAVANGTAALHIACLAAGLGPDGAALVPTLTFVATANAPIYCGATARLTDVDANSLSMTPSAVRRLTGAQDDVKAVMPVHFAGLASASAELRVAAGDRVVIEDACHALGGFYEDGSPVGGCAYSDMAAFSFHPVKPVTTGEGGAVTTNDNELARRLRLFRNHGIERDPARFVNVPIARGDDAEDAPWRYQQQVLGFNYRMTDMQAALGIAQLDKLDGFLARRREIAAFYDSRFAGAANLRIPQSGADQRARSGLHLYQIHVDFDAVGKSRTQVMAALMDAGVGTQIHYIPVHRQPFHASAPSLDGGFANAEHHYARTLSIPLFPSMTDEDVEYVVDMISRILA